MSNEEIALRLTEALIANGKLGITPGKPELIIDEYLKILNRLNEKRNGKTQVA